MKDYLHVNGVVCIQKDTSNSTTTLFVKTLKDYFDKLNGVENPLCIYIHTYVYTYTEAIAKQNGTQKPGTSVIWREKNA